MLDRIYSWLGLDVWQARIRHAASEGAVAIEDRLLLARLEWEEERRRWTKLVLLTIATLALTVVALVVASVAIMLAFWDSPHRTIALCVVAGVWLIGWGIALMTLVSTAKAGGNAFKATREEFLKDWTALKERL